MKKNWYKLMNTRIDNRNQYNGAMIDFYSRLFFDEPLQVVNYGMLETWGNYPVTYTIVKNGIDKAIVIHSLKRLESLGNETARQLIYEQFMDYELTISFNDLLQELRLRFIELEYNGDLSLTYDNKLAIPENSGMSENEFIKCIYGCVTGFLYANKTAIDKKHISYETGDGQLIDLLDRKLLAKYTEFNNISNRHDMKVFKKYVSANSNKQCIENRLNIIDGLLQGMDYKTIHATYNIPIGTIGDNIVAIRRLYKECFKCKHEFKNNDMEYNKTALLETDDNGQYIYETMGNRLLLAIANYTI